MSRFNLGLMNSTYSPLYIEQQPLTIHKYISLKYNRRLITSHSWYRVRSFQVVYEGNPMDLNKYYRFKEIDLKKTKPAHEIDDLILAHYLPLKSAS